jgi:hypothetical protein
MRREFGGFPATSRRESSLLISHVYRAYVISSKGVLIRR